MRIKRSMPSIIVTMMAVGAFAAGSTASTPNGYGNPDNYATTSSNTTVESDVDPDYYHDI